jgi:hypothetical protein
MQWRLRDFPVERLADREGAGNEAERRGRFRDALVERLAKATGS